MNSPQQQLIVVPLSSKPSSHLCLGDILPKARCKLVISFLRCFADPALQVLSNSLARPRKAAHGD